MNFLEQCRTLISFETTPQQGTRQCAEFLKTLAEDMGFAVELHEDTVAGLEHANVVIRPGLRVDQELLLQTHLDTPDAGAYALWTKTQSNPFNASIYGDTLYGLGVADCKLDILCKLEAAKEFVNRNLQLPFVIVGTFGAQSGMSGALKLVRKKLINAHMAMIGEPTGIRLASEGPGLAVVEVAVPFSHEEQAYRKMHDLRESASTQSKMFFGRAAHSSVPALGDNAIVKMLDSLVRLPQGIAIMDMDGGSSHNTVPSSAFLEIDLASHFRHSIIPKLSAILTAMHELESHVTLNLGTVRTFETNVTFVGSCRFRSEILSSQTEIWMAEFKSACEKQDATFCVKEFKAAFSTPIDSPFLQGCQSLLEEMRLPAAPVALTSSTEASILNRLGIQCLVFGPGQSVGNSHEPNERISIKELHTATNFYRQVIQRFCL